MAAVKAMARLAVASTFTTLARAKKNNYENGAKGPTSRTCAFRNTSARSAGRSSPCCCRSGPRPPRNRRYTITTHTVSCILLPPLDAATGGQGGRLARGALDPCAVRKGPAEPGAEGVFGLPDREVEESLVDFHGVELRPHRGSIAAHRGAAVLSEVAVEGDVVRLPVPRRDQRRVRAERES